MVKFFAALIVLMVIVSSFRAPRQEVEPDIIYKPDTKSDCIAVPTGIHIQQI